MDNDLQKTSYVVGRQIATNFNAQGLDLDLDCLFDGIRDGINGEDYRVSDEESAKLIFALESKIRENLEAKREAVIEQNRKDGEAFLAENAKRDGIITTESGLQYKILTEGSGPVPKHSDSVETHYAGTLINGEVFDSSLERGQPVSFPVSGVIQGWQEALQLMTEGSRWELYVPAHLAYGEGGSPPKIGPWSTLIFQVELLKVL